MLANLFYRMTSRDDDLACIWGEELGSKLDDVHRSSNNIGVILTQALPTDEEAQQFGEALLFF